FIGTTDAVDFSIRTDDETRVRVTSDGNVGIGTTTPGAYRLNVDGTTQLDGNTSITGNTTIGGTATIAGATTINNAATVTGTTSLNGGTGGGVTISGLPAATGAYSNLTVDGNGLVRRIDPPEIPDAWELDGNAGTDAANNFIGTTDAVDFSIRTDDETRVRVTSDGNVGIGTTTPGAYRLNVAGNTQLAGTASITGNTTIGGTATIAGATTINNTATVTGATTLNGGTGGGVTISGLTDIADGNILVTDANGKVATIATAPVKICFVQDVEAQPIEQADIASFNTGSPLVASWKSTDIEQNNLVDFNDTDDTFTLREGGNIEVSGFANYYAAAGEPSNNSDPDVALVNILIQRQVAGTTTWVQFAGARGILAGSAAQSNAITVVVPPTVAHLNAGDKLRMVVRRPTSGEGGTPQGLPHHQATRGGIDTAFGINFSKNLKILKLGE
ncbi:MAG: hypothetical protein LUG18_14310, partial [Candidatus Azobacteroides sp.]|nr:hypothetical protein [Candidatus Azobacteroides sp.]